MEVKIYQLTDEAFDRVNYVFMSWDRAKDEIDLENDYECVYTFHLSPHDSTPVMSTLDYIFDIFNNKRPGDFKGHSLSVSDVVCLDGVYYYCDNFGWELIKEGK